MICSSTCNSSSNCPSRFLSSTDAVTVEEILDKIISKELDYDDEAISLLCSFLTQDNYSSLCKLNQIYRKLQISERLEDFFLLLKLFIRHDIFGILICFAIEYIGDEPISNPLSFCYKYKSSFTAEMRQSFSDEVKLMINHVNLRLREYLVFNSDVKISQASY